jgi:primosomal protein N' (replication factor Y)
MRALAANGTFHVALLDGVTGSGKTEVYFEAIAETVRRGKQSLILMPEIALTGQFLDRFAQRFGVRPLEWHSELTPRTRARNWAAISTGQAPAVVGARSALFLPYADLGLIIIDEEHDQAYKQDDGAYYHARDMAVVRAHIAKIPIVLASATPSIETEGRAQGAATNAWRCRQASVVSTCRISRAIGSPRPPPPAVSSPVLAEAVQFAGWRTGAAAFLDRRGYAPLTCALRLSLPPSATPGWWITGFASAWSAIIAASRCRARMSARTARRRNRSPPSVRAWSACRKKPRASFRMPARWCCRAT